MYGAMNYLLDTRSRLGERYGLWSSLKSPLTRDMGLGQQISLSYFISKGSCICLYQERLPNFQP